MGGFRTQSSHDHLADLGYRHLCNLLLVVIQLLYHHLVCKVLGCLWLDRFFVWLRLRELIDRRLQSLMK
jgi:hypothetical protein